MAKGKLKAQAAKAGNRVKAPGTESAGSTNKEHPVFCLRNLRNLDDCEQEERAALADTLGKLARLTWQDIMSAPRHGCGCEKISVSNLDVSVGVELEKDQHVLAFRFCGKKPMIGLRENATLRLLYLDRDFKAYDHGS